MVSLEEGGRAVVRMREQGGMRAGRDEEAQERERGRSPQIVPLFPWDS